MGWPHLGWPVACSYKPAAGATKGQILIRAVDMGCLCMVLLLLSAPWTVSGLVQDMWAHAAWTNHTEPQMVLHPMKCTE